MPAPDDLDVDLTAGYADLDPDEVDALAAADGTPLDELRAELEADLAGARTRVEVDGRPGYVAVYRQDFTGKDVAAWRKKATRGKHTDETYFAGLVLASTLVAIERQGVEVTDPDGPGGLLGFGSPYLQQLYGTVTAVDTARAFFGTDGKVNSQAAAVLEAAGWGDEATMADPT